MGIFVWGTGCGASELLEQGLPLERICGFVDSFSAAAEFLGKPVYQPDCFPEKECDLLIVTPRQSEAIARKCRELGIPREKILFLKNQYEWIDRNAACTASGILEEELRNRILIPSHPVPVPGYLRNPVLSGRDLENDYVRLSTLELLCRRLKEIPGAAAELGVYRGAFARCINDLLPDRTLYLFDSFEGFPNNAGASEAFHEAHRNTGMDQVLAIMPHRESVVLKPGFFPHSLEGLEEQFCLVSLDVDFEQTTLDGLRYFWPRLNTGGYLLLHDWNDRKLTGVAAALTRYQQEINIRIPAVPLCDAGGTLVLCKP